MAFKVIALAKCLQSHPQAFTKGKIYQVYKIYNEGSPRLAVVADDSGQTNGWAVKFFELLPNTEAMKILYGK